MLERKKSSQEKHKNAAPFFVIPCLTFVYNQRAHVFQILGFCVWFCFCNLLSAKSFCVSCNHILAIQDVLFGGGLPWTPMFMIIISLMLAMSWKKIADMFDTAIGQTLQKVSPQEEKCFACHATVGRLKSVLGEGWSYNKSSAFCKSEKESSDIESQGHFTKADLCLPHDFISLLFCAYTSIRPKLWSFIF